MVIYQLCDKKKAMKSGVFRVINKIHIYIYIRILLFLCINHKRLSVKLLTNKKNERFYVIPYLKTGPFHRC